MKIIVGRLSGFCAGVTFTVNKAKEVLKEKNTVYCLGEIVHNESVVKMLENEDMVTVESIDEVPNGGNVIFRAHGEAEEVYNKAKKRDINVIDLTCGKVRRIHLDVQREKENKFIIIIGKKTHPETIGTQGFAGENCIVIEAVSEVEKAYELFKKSNLNKAYVVSQTTFSSKKFYEITKEIMECFKEAQVNINNTICDATEKRQDEVERISKDVDKMIIIGGKNSSNTKELAVISEKNCNKVYLVQDKNDLTSINFNKNDIIGIVSGASTPKNDVCEIKEYIENKTIKNLS